MTDYHVSSGVSSSLNLGNGDFEYVSSGGSAVSTTVSSGGGLNVYSGGSAVSTTVSSGGYEVVSSGGTASDTTVQPGGYLIVLSGGTQSNTSGTIVSTGVVFLQPASGVTLYGSHAADLVVSSGATAYILSGGTATATTLDSGGTEIVYSGGSTISTTVSSGGTDVVASGGTATATTVDITGTLDIKSGGSAVSTTVNSLGFEYVSSGGTASNTTVVSGGTETVLTGGTTISTTVSSGGQEYVVGGTASDTILSSGGGETVSGTAVNVTIANGGYITVYGSASNINAVLNGVVGAYQGTTVNTTLGFFSNMTVDSGATASNITLAGNFANVEIYSGANVIGTIDVATGALVNIGIAGSAMPTAVISGLGGGTVIDLQNVTYNASDSATYSSGTLTVSAGGNTYALNVASSTALGSGSFFVMSDGQGGTEIGFLGASDHIVSSGQSSSSIAVPGGAYLLVESGGTATSTTFSGAAPFMTYQSSSTDGGTLAFNSGTPAYALGEILGTASGAHVGYGGNLINAGQTISTTVTSGGVLFNLSGTVLSTTIQTSGIELDFLSGAISSDSIINGGLDGIAGGAVAIGAVVNAGGEQVVAGQVNFGGTLTPLAGGTASGTTIHSGGGQFVNISGTASGTQIDSGGRMVVNSGGSAVGATVSSGGVEIVSSGGSATSTTLEIGGTIDLASFAYAAGGSASLNSTTDVLTITEGGSSTQLQLAGSYSGEYFHLTSATGGGTLITQDGQPCFCRGTRILTERGEVAVEDLQVGERLMTRSGAARPIRWIGHRSVECRHHPRPHDVWPVRISAGAFGTGQPHRDMMLSPDHAVFIDGVLIPVRFLINGATIVQLPAERVGYWHVELETHDIILADGLTCETYLDTGNRGAFENGGPAIQIHPDFALRIWDAQACAPLVRDGAELEAARSWLLERAHMFGFVSTRDPDLHVIANGRTVLPEIEGTTYRFVLPFASGVRLVSRSTIPAELHADSRDHRRLGVAVARISLDGQPLALTGPALGSGWHPAEPDSTACAWRWTDGNAALAVSGKRSLDIEIAMTERYWIERGGQRQRVA